MECEKTSKLAAGKKALADYLPQFQDILTQIQKAKQKAYSQVNASVIELYRSIGQYIDQQVEKSDWGQGVVKSLAEYLINQDAELKSFSARNLWRMRQFFQVWQDYPKLSTLCTQLPWSHNRRIMTLKSPEEREFYLKLCAGKNYSFRELERLIQSGTYERTMAADVNLSEAIRQLPQNTEGILA